MVARSRFAEDELAASILTGATQYVVLGAGLDTFALRNPHPGLQVFEVDHPATQAWKRELLAAAGMTLPANAHLVPVDFERNHLATALLASGFNSQAKTIFAWLGVVPYLSSAAFRATLSFIATFPEGSGVIFDYGQPRAALPPLEQLAHDSLASRVQLAGEPFQLFFTPSGMTTELTAFRLITDLGSPGLNARFFTARSDTLRLVGSAGRLVSARL